MRRLRELARQAWYHRPVFMTLARLDDIEMDNFSRGVSFADANPAGTVITEPRHLHLLASR